MDDDVPEVDPKEFTILGVVLPLPPEAYEGKPADIQPAMECAKHWNKVLGTAAAKWVHDLKDDAVRRCLVAFMNGVCATLPDALQEHIMKPAGVVSLDVRKYTPEMTRRADAFIDLMCRDARTIGGLHRPIQEVSTRLLRSGVPRRVGASQMTSGEIEDVRRQLADVAAHSIAQLRERLGLHDPETCKRVAAALVPRPHARYRIKDSNQ